MNWKNLSISPIHFCPSASPCRAIILSLAANQQSDYQAVDLSQYEEKGIAHLIIGRACSIEQLMCDQVAQEERFDEKEVAKNGLLSALVPNATLLHYEALGVWDFEEEE